ncbi:MAG: LytTR family DNA-binding domain-containing protein [Crocinitomicaceae bacterium]|nr:LytTR family DNA-binding domain-containing protein [Crocinitomicaceae bacterium]
MFIIKALIIDDETAAQNILRSLLKLSFPNIDVVGIASNLRDGVDLIKIHSPDLVFLDVDMPKYAGYEIVDFLPKIDFHIVFVTAYNKYAINAFEINATDYLLKPIERKLLARAIERVKQRMRDEQAIVDHTSLLNQLKEYESETITFSELGKKNVVKLQSIIAIKAQRAYSEIRLMDNSKLTVSKNLSSLEKELGNAKCFFRSHKSWIINTNHIISFQVKNNTIELKNDVTAVLSRSKKEVFKKQF